RSTREPKPTSARRPSASAFARVYETRNDPITAANVATSAISFPSRMKTSPIDVSIAASPSRSNVESRNAPKTVPLLAARANAPSRMSATEPTTNRKPPSQKNSISLRSSNPTSTAPARQSETPASVSMSGVNFVFATPRMERWRISRAAQAGQASPAEHESGNECEHEARDDVEPIVVSGRDDCEPDPDRPREPKGLRKLRSHDAEHHDPDDQR